MVPSRFVYMQMMPLSLNGKLDRRALPSPDWTPHRKEVAAPRTALERKIAVAWQGLLDVKEVDVHENFFDAGGHSLLLLRLASRLRELLGTEVSTIDLFRHPTICSQAAYFGGKIRESDPMQSMESRAQKQREAIGLQKQIRENATKL